MTPLGGEMTDRPSCGNCRFWYDDPTNQRGFVCRRFPPRIIDAFVVDGLKHPDSDHDDIIDIASYYPAAYEDNWCGEWRPLHPQAQTTAPNAAIEAMSGPIHLVALGGDSEP